VAAQDHGHLLLVAEVVEPVEELPPIAKRLDVALAESWLLDRRPAVLLAGVFPDQRLQPVHRVHDHRSVFVILVDQGVERRPGLGVILGRRKCVVFQSTKAVLDR